MKNKIIKILKFIWKEFIYGGHFQCLGAASIVFISIFFLKINLSWGSLITAYFLFYPLYIYNRWKEIEIDYITNPGRTAHLRTYLKQMPIIFWTSVFIIIGLLVYFGNFYSFIFGFILLISGLLYTTIFKKVTKRIFLFKNLYVALFFALLVLFTVIYYSVPLDSFSFKITGILIIFVFIKAFLMQILLDLKDVESDAKQGLKTLSVVLGRDKTFELLKILSILTTAPIIIFFSLFIPIFPKSILMFLFTIPFNFYCFKLAQDKKYFGYILGSGEFLFWAILILLGEIIL